VRARFRLFDPASARRKRILDVAAAGRRGFESPGAAVLYRSSADDRYMTHWSIAVGTLAFLCSSCTGDSSPEKYYLVMDAVSGGGQWDTDESRKAIRVPLGSSLPAYASRNRTPRSKMTKTQAKIALS
jgi:hypothetical protein